MLGFGLGDRRHALFDLLWGRCVEIGHRHMHSQQARFLDRHSLRNVSREGESQLGGLLGNGEENFSRGVVVNLEEVDSRTMESKLVPDFYLAGEVLDLDGPIGGFNFQAAWSTGWLAGENA